MDLSIYCKRNKVREVKYMKRNITSYGTSFINEFLKHYKLACVPREDKYQNEHTINDIKKFEEILNKLSDEYEIIIIGNSMVQFCSIYGKMH